MKLLCTIAQKAPARAKTKTRQCPRCGAHLDTYLCRHHGKLVIDCARCCYSLVDCHLNAYQCDLCEAGGTCSPAGWRKP